MGALAAEQPDGLGVVDHDGEDRDLAHGDAGGNGLEGREDAGGAGVDAGDGDAWVVEVGLSDGMVTGPELELDHAAGLGFNLAGEELQTGLVLARVLSNGDDVDIDGCTRGLEMLRLWWQVGVNSTLSNAQQRGESKSCELHFERLSEVKK